MYTYFLCTIFYGIYLILPGYLFLSCIGIYRHKFILSYAISISILVITVTPFLWFGGNLLGWFAILNLLIITTILCTYFLLSVSPLSQCRKPNPRPFVQIKSPDVGCVILVLCFSLYYFLVGPYTEVPSDYWKHLARINIEYDNISGGTAGYSLSSRINLDSSSIYTIHAFVARICGIRPNDLVFPATLVTNNIFLVCVYWFSFRLLANFRLSTRMKVLGALLASVLTLLAFGTATFSFIRYYGFFPTILAFPLIYAATVILLDFLERTEANYLQLTLAPLILITMFLIHRQELALTLILLASITLVKAIRGRLPNSYISELARSRATFCALFSLVVVAILVIHAVTNKSIRPWTNTPHVIDAKTILPMLSGLPLDNPAFRFWDTLGYFGLVVYLWFIFRWRIFLRQDFILASMLIPLFTNLNPLFAMFFLHYAGPTAIWRTAYLMPLGIVAAMLFTSSFGSRQIQKNLRQPIIGATIMIILFICLLPWEFAGHYNRTSRIPSLRAVHEISGAGLWDDLISAVEEIQRRQPIRRIVTDSVTRFVLYSATRSEIWWDTGGEYFPKNNEIYRNDFMTSDFSHSLLVVNNRNGIETESARYSHHWPVDILNVSTKYPEDLEEFIAINPNLFDLLWSSDDIKVYLMYPENQINTTN